MLLAIVGLVLAGSVFQSSASPVANTLEFNYFHCFLRNVASCLEEYIPAFETIKAINTCKTLSEVAARTSPDFRCTADDVQCWKSCRTDDDDDEEDAQTILLNDTMPHVLHAPENVTVSWLNGTSVHPLTLLVRWSKVDNASAYLVQHVSYNQQPITWTLSKDNYRIVYGERFEFQKDSYCFTYGFRVMAISPIVLSSFSSIVESPTLDKIQLDKFTMENDVEFRTNAKSKKAWFFSRVKSTNPWPQRLQKYSLSYSFYVRWPTLVDEYYLKIHKEKEIYTTNKGYRIYFPENLIASGCGGIVIIEKLDMHSCDSVVNISTLAFRVSFNNQTMNMTATSTNCTREFILGLMDSNSQAAKEFISVSENMKGFYDLTIGKIEIVRRNHTELVLQENENVTKKKSIQKISDLLLSPYIPSNDSFINGTNSTSYRDKDGGSSNFSQTHYISIGVCLGVASLTVSAVLFFAYKNNLKRNLQKQLYMKTTEYARRKTSPHYSEFPKQTRDVWEIDRAKLLVDEQCKLGSGAFGAVYKGVLYQETQNTGRVPQNKRTADKGFTVAVKTLAAHLSEFEAFSFRQEIELMKKIGYHDRLVNILGCVTVGDTLLLVEEFCSEGDLLKYLRTRRKYMLEIEKSKLEDDQQLSDSQSLDPNMMLSLEDLLLFSWQVASGMDYLTQKGFLHRDLAARNILVDEGKKIKIGDFGLSRIPKNDSIYFGHGGKLPVKWMAIEALKDSTFTAASDVWSFGILLFEIITLGGAPYPDVEPPHVIDYLQSGQRMEKPDNCSDDLYSIMRECWDDLPDNRPTFSKLQLTLGRMIENLSDQDYYVCLSDNKDYYNVEKTHSTGSIL